MRKLPQYIHIVWSKTTGPMWAYVRPIMAHSHALTMVGVDVGTCELREELPDNVVADIASDNDYDADDLTPVAMDDIDDASE